MIFRFIFVIMALGALVAGGAESIKSPGDTFPPPMYKKADLEQDGLNYIGSCMWRGIFDAKAVGDYAYLATFNGLMILDISDPSAPAQVSKTYIPMMWAHSIEVRDDYAYLVDYYGLKIVYINDPSAPKMAGRCGTIDSTAYDIALAGNYAVVAQMHNGLQVIDISDPFFPVLAGAHDTPGQSRSVVIRDDTLAFLADGTGGLQIINFANPYAPDSVGAVAGFGYTQEIDIEGDFAYLASPDSGLEIIIVADPGNPYSVASFRTPGGITSVMVDGDYAYAIDPDSGMLILDISNPFSPTHVGTMPVMGKVCDIIGNAVYGCLWTTSFYIINVGSPQSPVMTGSYTTPLFGPHFEIRDNYAYGPRSHFDVIDISDPTDPYRAGYAEGDGYFIDLINDYACVVGTDSVFRIYDISDPLAPDIVGSIDNVGYAYDIAVEGGYAFLTTWQNGLAVVDISNPNTPSVVANHMEYSPSGYLELRSNLLYSEDVRITDVSDPFNPLMVADSQFYGNTHDGAIEDTLLYLASGDSELMNGWLRAVSIADSTNPYTLGSYYISNEAYGVDADGSRVCLTDGAGLYLFDVSDPSQPDLLAGRGGIGISDVRLIGNYIYASNQYGFYVFRYGPRCGDTNGDGVVDIGDAVFLLHYIFEDGPAPSPLCIGDVGGAFGSDGATNVADAVFLITYIFRHGPAPGDNCCD